MVKNNGRDSLGCDRRYIGALRGDGKMRRWITVTMWMVWVIGFRISQKLATPYLTQQGALEQFNDSYTGFVANQTTPYLVDVVFGCLAIILLFITYFILKEKKT